MKFKETKPLVLLETPVHSPGQMAKDATEDETVSCMKFGVDDVVSENHNRFVYSQDAGGEGMEIKEVKHFDRGKSLEQPFESKESAGSGDGCSHEDVWECHSNVVFLHVYDLTPTISKYVNTVMRPLGAGAFHAGVEVFGDEYCFGRTNGNS